MKNLSIVLNAILIIAVGVLYYFHFNGTTEAVEQPTSSSTSQTYEVAYINADSVLKNYEYFTELQEQLKAKTEKLEAEYQNRAQGLQQELTDYQRNVSNLTIGQAKALEENLMKKQQNLRMYQESLTQELMKEESKMNRQLYDKVTAFIKEYSLKNGVNMVVKYNQGSDVLYATEGMDITDRVVEGLNESYNKGADTPVDSVQSN